jgi:hypothetical protein
VTIWLSWPNAQIATVPSARRGFFGALIRCADGTVRDFAGCRPRFFRIRHALRGIKPHPSDVYRVSAKNQNPGNMHGAASGLILAKEGLALICTHRCCVVPSAFADDGIYRTCLFDHPPILFATRTEVLSGRVD